MLRRDMRKNGWISPSLSLISRLVLLAVLLPIATTYVKAQSHTPVAESQEFSGLQHLSASGQLLRTRYISAPRLPDLCEPDFANEQHQTAKFYEEFIGTLPWVAHGKPTPPARALIFAFQNARYKGLNPDDYNGPRWKNWLDSFDQKWTLSESDLVKFDLAVTVSAIRYVSDLHNGRLDPRMFHLDLDTTHARFVATDFIAQKLVSASDVSGSLAVLDPPFPVYRRTEIALRKYLELSGLGDGEPIPMPAKTVKPGTVYSALPALIAKLKLVGDLSSQYSPADTLYQGAVVDAMKRFQTRQGLEPTGAIDSATVVQLNTPLAKRVTQLGLTMERMRWLPHEFDRPPIVVNIPEFRLHADDQQYHWVLSVEVVVGKAYGYQTPVFASQITSVIFRPYWNVPASIVEAEVIPHIEKNSSYLLQNSYQIVDKKGAVVSTGAVTPEILGGLRSGELRPRQTPGPENSLGLVKFNIPSPYDVYMHGTPAMELFSRSRRDFSHGCIRVQDPVKLAKWVLQENPEWTESKILSAINGDATIEVKVKNPIPVLILYGTAVVMENGEVHFFSDIYGHDVSLEQALAARSARGVLSQTPKAR